MFSFYSYYLSSLAPCIDNIKDKNNKVKIKDKDTDTDNSDNIHVNCTDRRKAWLANYDKESSFVFQLWKNHKAVNPENYYK